MDLGHDTAATMPEGRVVDVDVPETLLARLLMAMHLPPFVHGVIAATPSLRLPWLAAAAAVSLFAVWGAVANDQVLAFVIVAPVLPVAGVAAAYGPWADPMFETERSTPVSGFHVVLARTVAVILTCVPVLVIAALIVPETRAAALMWVLPALALASSSLVVSTFTSLPVAAAIVTSCWFAAVVVASVLSELPVLFQGPAQLVFLAVTLGASLAIARRRERFEIEGLQTRRALVDAADAERRRIERNIHDGAQQQLVAIGVKAGLARAFVVKDPDRAIAIIDELRADTQHALDGLRDMTRGGYPPVLADEGLEGALTLQAKRAAVPVTLEVRDVGRLPKSLEIAVYFCCLEAMQNAAKYAHASALTVTLRRSVDEVTFSVCDDGIGFDPTTVRRGIGMRSMSERIGSLGGELEVRSVLGAGTVVTGRLGVGGASIGKELNRSET
jgi:signal transduction histidine kinase